MRLRPTCLVELELNLPLVDGSFDLQETILTWHICCTVKLTILSSSASHSHRLNVVNPKGLIPTSLVNIVITEIPQCVVNVAELLKKYGLVSYVPEGSSSSTFWFTNYDHSKRQNVIGLIGKSGDEFDILVDTKVMYKDGYSVFVDDSTGGVIVNGHGSDKLHVVVGDAADGAKVLIVTTGLWALPLPIRQILYVLLHFVILFWVVVFISSHVAHFQLVNSRYAVAGSGS